MKFSSNTQRTQGEEDASPKKKRCWRWFMAVVLLVAFYVLSIGPAVRMVIETNLTQTTIDKVYKPLDVLSDASPFIENLLNRYITLWLP